MKWFMTLLILVVLTTTEALAYQDNLCVHGQRQWRIMQLDANGDVTVRSADVTLTGRIRREVVPGLLVAFGVDEMRRLTYRTFNVPCGMLGSFDDPIIALDHLGALSMQRQPQQSLPLTTVIYLRIRDALASMTLPHFNDMRPADVSRAFAELYYGNRPRGPRTPIDPAFAQRLSYDVAVASRGQVKLARISWREFMYPSECACEAPFILQGYGREMLLKFSVAPGMAPISTQQPRGRF